MDATFHTETAIFNYRVAGIMIKNNHVLLHKQADDSHWGLPGGRVKLLEDSKTSVKREIKEELGFTVEVEKLLWTAECFFEYDKEQYHELGFYYKLTLEEPISSVSNKPFYGEEGEHLIYQWVPITELSSIVLYPAFLKTSLIDLPTTSQHLIIDEYKM